MLWWSWLKWPDIVVDFGKELYIAWQLVEGKTLYSDIAYFNGPLSPYLNAFWFRLFGVSFRTLALCNVAILAAIAWTLHRLLSRIAGRFAATAACLAFLTLFAFGQLTNNGNYNFVCPITHEMNHGMALSLAAILLLAFWLEGRGVAWLAGSGLVLGLVFLTRAELFLAAAGAVAVGVLLAIGTAGPGRSRPIRTLGAFVLPVLTAPLAAFFCLRLAMPAAQALTGTLGTWPSVFHGDVAELPFYQKGMGLDDPGASLLKLFVWTAWYTAVFAPPAVAALLLRKTRRPRLLMAVAVFIGLGGALWLARREVAWADAARPLPLVLLAVGTIWLFAMREAGRIGATGRAARSEPTTPPKLEQPEKAPGGRPGMHADRALGGGESRSARTATIFRITLIVFALALLAKMILFTRIYHYGFALAMPAALLVVVALLDWLPGAINRRGGSGEILRAAALGVLVAAAASYLEVNARIFRARTYEVSSGADRILADERGKHIVDTLSEIARRPGKTLAALPEGAMLNFLSRRANPTPYPILMPTEMTMFGEDAILAAFKANPPDLIALVHRNTSEFKVRFFAKDYARGVGAWIDAEYRPVFLAGATPFRDQRFGILLLERARTP